MAVTGSPWTRTWAQVVVIVGFERILENQDLGQVEVEEVVFVDDKCSEALHWSGGAGAMLEAGAPSSPVPPAASMSREHQCPPETPGSSPVFRNPCAKTPSCSSSGQTKNDGASLTPVHHRTR